MKTIGMIGGISWESSATYYRLINTRVRERLGGHANARSLLLTVDFREVVALQEAGDWETLAALMQACARHLEQAGADCLLICANTMHKVAPQVERVLTIPLIHIVDVTAAAIRGSGIARVGLLGTRYVMEQAFYRDRLAAVGIETIVPGDQDRALVHQVIFEELTRGVVRDVSRQAYIDIIARLSVQGAQGILLGCTELSMLIKPDDVDLPIFDSTVLHADAAVNYVLA